MYNINNFILKAVYNLIENFAFEFGILLKLTIRERVCSRINTLEKEVVSEILDLKILEVLNLNFSRNLKRIFSFISAMVLTLSFAASVSATEEPIDYGQLYGVVNIDSLNVREYSDIDSPVIAELKKNTYVRVNWIEPDWVCVAYNNDGLMGYVSSEYINVFEGEIPDFTSAPGQAAVDLAATFLGVPYVWGGTSPAGFDCSGLMQYVYNQLGYKINRVAADQMKNGIAVSRENLMPGDLVGFYSSPGSGYVSHIGMYVGDGMMIHAPHTGDVVKYTSIDGSYYSSRFAGGRRIMY